MSSVSIINNVKESIKVEIMEVFPYTISSSGYYYNNSYSNVTINFDYKLPIGSVIYIVDLGTDVTLSNNMGSQNIIGATGDIITTSSRKTMIFIKESEDVIRQIFPF